MRKATIICVCNEASDRCDKCERYKRIKPDVTGNVKAWPKRKPRRIA